jgi:hypothetical protein
MWLIAEDCHELLDALPVLVADQEKDGDIVKTDSISDDIADTARYGIKSMLALHPKPKEVERREMLEGFDDELETIRKMREARK